MPHFNKPVKVIILEYEDGTSIAFQSSTETQANHRAYEVHETEKDTLGRTRRPRLMWDFNEITWTANKRPIQKEAL